MRTLQRLLLFLSSAALLVYGVPISSLTSVACQRNSSLPFCFNKMPIKQAKESTHPYRSHLLQELDENSLKEFHSFPSDQQEAYLDIASIARLYQASLRTKRASTDEAERIPTPHQNEDLREKEDDKEDEGFIAEDNDGAGKLREKEEKVEEFDDEPQPTNSEKMEYCEKYEQHFSFYCVGDVDRTGKYEQVIEKFCPAYKNACPGKQITSSTSLTSWPSNPFTKVVTTRPSSSVSSTTAESDEESTEEDDQSEQEVYLEELKRRFPCKPDCDRRIFPHCTADCKCDYSYPATQRFCNPPAIPLFLQICRLWYNGCPKYERYHYASQFIYSKAEKGKRLDGTNSPNPYGIPSPLGTAPIASGSPTGQAIDRSTQHLIPLAQGSKTVLVEPPQLPSDTLVEPPHLPRETFRREAQSTHRERRKKKKHTLSARARKMLEQFERNKRGHRDRRHRRKDKHRHRRKHRDTVEEKNKNSQTPPSREDLIRTLRALNSFTKNPTKLTQEPATLKSGTKPRAQQVSTFPVVPSDAAYGATPGGDPFSAFNGLTDSRGQLHRPKSSSPFSRPGLWEPNPDDPHSRDRANKYYYAPASVGADWLNGQVTWGAHYAIPAAGVGGTNGFSALHFPSIGTFLNIPDDYD